MKASARASAKPARKVRAKAGRPGRKPGQTSAAIRRSARANGAEGGRPRDQLPPEVLARLGAPPPNAKPNDLRLWNAKLLAEITWLSVSGVIGSDLAATARANATALDRALPAQAASDDSDADDEQDDDPDGAELEADDGAGEPCVSASRYPRLVVSIRLADTRKGPDGRARWTPGTDEEIGKVGGCWDTRRKRWVRGAKARGMLVLRFHRGQEDAARWFAEWMRRFASGDWAGVERMWSVMLVGARRSGKTHIACAVMIAFAVLAPASRLWAVSPTLETGDELDAAFRELLPRRWYVRRQAKTGRATTYRLSNGSTINLRSAVKPERLKAGRVDMALLNEAQEIDELAYLKLRPATADRGGLVLLTCNPPDRPVGRWIEKHYFKAIAGELDGKAFVLDPRRNPWVNYEALSSMAKESDEKTYARDILGLFAPVGDQVFHAWSDVENWKDPPPDLVDITAMVARRELGAAAGYLVGEDFQRVPSMVACVHRVFLDPKTGLELLWVVDEVIADESDENDLCDGLEGLPRWRPGDGTPSKRDHGEGYRGWKLPEDRNDAPGHCAVIMDASGFFQDGDHKQNRSSEKWLRARQWTSLYKPQKDSDRNPAIIERMRTGNALLKSAGDVRRLFVARHCVRTAEAFKNYENKNGSPNRRSAFAHVIDAVTYVAYRLYGRPLIKARVEYFGAKRFTRGEMFAR